MRIPPIHGFMIFTSAIVLALIMLGGCYSSSGLTGDGSDDARPETGPDGRDTVDVPPDRPPDHPPDIPPDHWPDSPPEVVDIEPDTGECRLIPATVLAVDFDLEGCWDEDPSATVIIHEVAPFCGYYFEWRHDFEWTDYDLLMINASVFMCSDTWEPCDPGEVNTEYLRVRLPGPGVYEAVVNDMPYSFACLEGECPWMLADLDGFYPTGSRRDRLYGTWEEISFEVIYTTGFCGCSEFEPLRLINPDYMHEGYYTGTLSGQVCYDECCWDCDCIDVEVSEQEIDNIGAAHAYEIILEGSSREIRGLVSDPIANPMSECSVFPLHITAVDGRDYYDLGEPVELLVTVEYESYPSPTCCETHSQIAFDLLPGNRMHLFGFGGECMACYDDSCPPDETRSVEISAFALNIGEHTVIAEDTGEALYRFFVVGED